MLNEITEDNCSRHLDSISNDNLRKYFDECFQRAIEQAGVFPAWVCIDCSSNGNEFVDWGNKPRNCDRCNSKKVYEVATFQGRAPLYGAAFSAALATVAKMKFQLTLTHTPGNTKTHDLEAAPIVVIEAKGSARQLRLPNGTVQRLTRPGLLRSDTEKKAFDNARKFKLANPAGVFFIATNALPARLIGHRGENVDGIFDVTKKDRLEAMIRELKAALGQ